jgi:hypothetical protein
MRPSIDQRPRLAIVPPAASLHTHCLQTANSAPTQGKSSTAQSGPSRRRYRPGDYVGLSAALHIDGFAVIAGPAFVEVFVVARLVAARRCRLVGHGSPALRREANGALSHRRLTQGRVDDDAVCACRLGKSRAQLRRANRGWPAGNSPALWFFWNGTFAPPTGLGNAAGVSPGYKAPSPQPRTRACAAAPLAALLVRREHCWDGDWRHTRGAAGLRGLAQRARCRRGPGSLTSKGMCRAAGLSGAQAIGSPSYRPWRTGRSACRITCWKKFSESCSSSALRCSKYRRTRTFTAFVFIAFVAFLSPDLFLFSSMTSPHLECHCGFSPSVAQDLRLLPRQPIEKSHHTA